MGKLALPREVDLNGVVHFRAPPESGYVLCGRVYSVRIATRKNRRKVDCPQCLVVINWIQDHRKERL